MEELYIPAEQSPFQIRFRDNIRPDGTKRFSFFHATKFFSRIYTVGGRWWQTALFLCFYLFVFFPVAIVFDLLILIITGVLYGVWIITIALFKQVFRWLGAPISIGLSFIVIVFLLIILWYHFTDIVNFINSLIKF